MEGKVHAVTAMRRATRSGLELLVAGSGLGFGGFYNTTAATLEDLGGL